MAIRRNVAIIGLGPRGTWALENFILELHQQDQLRHIHLLLFEETGHYGNGKVYDTNQIQSNWINISERILLLGERAKIDSPSCQIPAFPSYHSWANLDFDMILKEQADTYPPRAKIGAYLHQRFQSFIEPLVNVNLATLHTDKVEEVSVNVENKIQINTNLNFYKDIDEALLTIGHQPTQLSEQLSNWEKFANRNPNVTLYTAPYPIRQFINHEQLTEESKVGIRGFGLAMIDVVRSIAHKFGKFVTHDDKNKSCTYATSYNLKEMLIPFSLDGLPPVPKPINALVDEWYKPTAQQLRNFETQIGNTLLQQQAHNTDFLIQAFAPIAAETFIDLDQTYGHGHYITNEIEQVITAWLRNNDHEHATLMSVHQPVQKTIQEHITMALGHHAISLDYCVGQVWRYCQASIYKQLSYNACTEEVFAEIIALDESTKRYSYGPPVESMQQLLALIKADVMTTDMVNNPDFKLLDDGWYFSKDGKSITADIMINSVLSAPQIKSVNSPLVKNMLSDELIEAVHDDLGVSTDENGFLQSTKASNLPIALLGRLAKGTIIGVDAILECFGERPQKWAKQAAINHKKYIRNQRS